MAPPSASTTSTGDDKTEAKNGEGEDVTPASSPPRLQRIQPGPNAFAMMLDAAAKKDGAATTTHKPPQRGGSTGRGSGNEHYTVNMYTDLDPAVMSPTFRGQRGAFISPSSPSHPPTRPGAGGESSNSFWTAAEDTSARSDFWHRLQLERARLDSRRGHDTAKSAAAKKQREDEDADTKVEERLRLVPSPDPNAAARPTHRYVIEDERREERLLQLIRNGGATGAEVETKIANIHGTPRSVNTSASPLPDITTASEREGSGTTRRVHPRRTPTPLVLSRSNKRTPPLGHSGSAVAVSSPHLYASPGRRKLQVPLLNMLGISITGTITPPSAGLAAKITTSSSKSKVSPTTRPRAATTASPGKVRISPTTPSTTKPLPDPTKQKQKQTVKGSKEPTPLRNVPPKAAQILGTTTRRSMMKLPARKDDAASPVTAVLAADFGKNGNGRAIVNGGRMSYEDVLWEEEEEGFEEGPVKKEKRKNNDQEKDAKKVGEEDEGTPPTPPSKPTPLSKKTSLKVNGAHSVLPLDRNAEEHNIHPALRGDSNLHPYRAFTAAGSSSPLPLSPCPTPTSFGRAGYVSRPCLVEGMGTATASRYGEFWDAAATDAVPGHEEQAEVDDVLCAYTPSVYTRAGFSPSAASYGDVGSPFRDNSSSSLRPVPLNVSGRLRAQGEQPASDTSSSKARDASNSTSASIPLCLDKSGLTPSVEDFVRYEAFGGADYATPRHETGSRALGAKTEGSPASPTKTAPEDKTPTAKLSIHATKDAAVETPASAVSPLAETQTQARSKKLRQILSELPRSVADEIATHLQPFQTALEFLHGEQEAQTETTHWIAEAIAKHDGVLDTIATKIDDTAEAQESRIADLETALRDSYETQKHADVAVQETLHATLQRLTDAVEALTTRVHTLESRIENYTTQDKHIANTPRASVSSDATSRRLHSPQRVSATPAVVGYPQAIRDPAGIATPPYDGDLLPHPRAEVSPERLLRSLPSRLDGSRGYLQGLVQSADRSGTPVYRMTK